jgi:hypothetical protein
MGLSSAKDNFLLAASVQNLQGLANLDVLPPPGLLAAHSHA